MNWLVREQDSDDSIRLDINTPKGTRIEPAIIEQLIGHERGTTAYAFTVMKICARFNNESIAGEHKKVARQLGSGVEICTDDEAMEYAEKTYIEGVRKIKKSILIDDMVEEESLSIERRAELRRRHQIKVGSYDGMLAGAKKAKQALRAGK